MRLHQMDPIAIFGMNLAIADDWDTVFNQISFRNGKAFRKREYKS